MITITIIIGIIGLVIGFIKFSPQFGASKKEKQTLKVFASPNFHNGLFHNPEETLQTTDFKFKTFFSFFKTGDKAPEYKLPFETLGSKYFQQAHNGATKVTWFGHSAILLEIDGKRIFLDPMLGKAPAPHPWLGFNRFNPELPIDINAITHLDAIVISHDHYDHLDYNTIQLLKGKTKHFYVPLGVGAHLISWGVDSKKIHEMDWWETANLDGLRLSSAPARHFSGRGMNDRNSTQWCSWVIESTKEKIFFSGDSGYGKHFKEIGEKYGPFDLCLLECGQYNEQWAHIHMMPEQTVQANRDLGGKMFIPIHWAAFKLSLHSWKEPIQRVYKKALELDQKMASPKIGEVLTLGNGQYPNSKWWQNYN